MASINDLIARDAGTVPAGGKRTFSASAGRSSFPNRIDLSCHMTKPEDQGSHGTCMAFSGTTFVESLLWKLTSEKEEFTADELYNLYFDTWGAMQDQDPDCHVVDALTRKGLRGEDGKWDTEWPDEYGGLSYFRWRTAQPVPISLTDGSWTYCEYSIYYRMLHYNDPDARKNHYPDKFSRLCEKVRNYLSGKLYQENGVSSETVRYPVSGGKTNTMYEVSPLRVKYYAQLNHMPMKASLPSYSGGHAVVFYNYGPSSVYFNSSWDDEKIWTMSLDYKETTSAISTDHYYSNFQSHSGWCGYNFIGIDAIDFYKESSVAKRRVTSMRPDFGSGCVYGVRSGDRVDSGVSATLIAVPDEGYYFKCWDDQFETGEYCSDVRTFCVTSDISVTAQFTSDPDDAYRVWHRLDFVSADNCQVKCGGYEGELISGSMPVASALPSGSSYWKCGSFVTMQAYPANGYSFVCWNDGSAVNPRRFSLSSDAFAYPVVSAG